MPGQPLWHVLSNDGSRRWSCCAVSGLHRNPGPLFPNRAGGLEAAASASTPLDRGGVQLALRKVVAACGLKKRSRLMAYAIIPGAE